MELKDDSILEIGRLHKGKKLADVPDKWFLWFWGENKAKYLSGNIHNIKVINLMNYIENSFDDKQLGK